MMKGREFLKTKKGQLTLVLSLFALSQIFLFTSFGGCDIFTIPGDKERAAMRKNLQKLRAEYASIAAEQEKGNRQKQEYRARMSDAWIIAHDGPVETILRRKISEVATAQNFKLNMLGSVRLGQINSDFSYAEIDIASEGELQDVIRFLAALRKVEPLLGWKRLDLSPDRRSFFQRNSKSGGNLAAKENSVPATRITFNGTLRVLIYRGPLSVAALKIKRPAFRPEPPPADGGMDPFSETEAGK